MIFSVYLTVLTVDSAVVQIPKIDIPSASGYKFRPLNLVTGPAEENGTCLLCLGQCTRLVSCVLNYVPGEHNECILRTEAQEGVLKYILHSMEHATGRVDQSKSVTLIQNILCLQDKQFCYL